MGIMTVVVAICLIFFLTACGPKRGGENSDGGGGGSDGSGGSIEGTGSSTDGSDGAPDGDGDSGSDGETENPYFGKTWGMAELIETDDSEDASSPQIAFDSSGNAIAVWHQYDGSRYSIYANRYIAGAGWSTAGLIETGDTGEASSPQIAFDLDGNAIAVWHQYDGSSYSILANRYVAGAGWGASKLIETNDTGEASSPQIAIDLSGNTQARAGARRNLLKQTIGEMPYIRR
jgi:hypothetical protein